MKNEYQTTRIVKISKETEKVKTFTLGMNVDAKPGQYVMVWIPRENEKPFGVVSTAPLTLAIAHVGQFTEKVHALSVGDKITFRGPYGSSFTLRGSRPVLVAGGYGFVPLYRLAESFSGAVREKTIVILGARTKADLPFEAKFKKLGCQVIATTDDGSNGRKGFTTQVLEEVCASGKVSSVYTCGPEIMMKKIAEICQTKKIFCQVSIERMFKCGGLGLCGECNIKGHLVCKEGPVFSGNILL